MSTIDELLALDGRGLLWLIEVSFDNFATVDYRWSKGGSGEMPTLASINAYFEERILEIGNIGRNFGQDHLPVANTTDLVLDNTDFVADWLFFRDTVGSQVFKARFRISLGLTELVDGYHQASVKTKMIGEYVCLDYPRADDRQVFLSLTDDSLGRLADLLVAPSLQDWIDDAGTTASNAVFVGQDLAAFVDVHAPAPLQFGVGPYSGTPLGIYTAPRAAGSTVGISNRQTLPILVCATRDSAVISVDDVTSLIGVYRKDVENRPDLAGYAMPIPRTTTDHLGNVTDIWTPYKTQTITKNGYDWKLLWIAFNTDAYAAWAQLTFTINPIDLPPTQSASHAKWPVGPGYKGYGNATSTSTLAPAIFTSFAEFIVEGLCGSGINGKTTKAYNAVDVMRDLAEYYSSMGTAGIDTARFARARLACQMPVRGAIYGDGVSAASRVSQQLSTNVLPYGIGTLRKAIAELAGSADLDVFVTSAGQVAVVAQGADFLTQTVVPVEIEEEKAKDIQTHIPSSGERWQPYNRIFVTSETGEQLGPADDPDAITEWGRILAKVFPGKWWAGLTWWIKDIESANQAYADAGNRPFLWRMRGFEAKVRPILTFTTDLVPLGFELGDYFLFSWTRSGLSTVFASSMFRLEGMTIHPQDGSIEVSGVWMGDLQTDQPFLLDNEDLFVRAPGTSYGNLTLTSSSGDITVLGGDLVADGVVPGDLIRLRDTAEAGNEFKRNRDIRISAVIDDLDMTVSGDLDFGSAGPYVVAAADWSIVRGATTYPSHASDPTNYPNGSAFFGKVSNFAGQFSDATPANKLLDG